MPAKELDLVPHISFGRFPTPLHHAETLAKQLNIKSLYIKRDDQSGPQSPKLPGGNKVRKLEFLLADALNKGARSVLTFGDAGSNHALATTIYAKQAGLKSIIMLTPQIPTAYTRRNLLLNLYFGADIRYFSSEKERDMAVAKLMRPQGPYIIPIGGSNEIGCLGFVNAAFELKDQIAAGIMPKPDIIYITLGSSGMAAGLALGLKMAKIPCKIIAVHVNPTFECKETELYGLIKKTTNYLHQSEYSFTEQDITCERNFAGPTYAHITEEAAQAIKKLSATEDIKLEGTYTGKTFSALCKHAQTGSLCDKTVLFWNSFSAGDFSQYTNQVSYKDLPEELHRYFTEPLQKLDAGY